MCLLYYTNRALFIYINLLLVASKRTRENFTGRNIETKKGEYVYNIIYNKSEKDKNKK